jgi:CRP-like cAMP-binding protein
MVSADLFKTFDFFQGFTDEELKQLENIASRESYKAGVQLWKKGDSAGKLLLLKEGKVLMTLDLDMGSHRPPMQVTVDVVTKGEGMGWSAVVEPYLYTRGARCIDDSEVIAFDAAQLRDVLDRDKTLGYKFMHVIAKVIRNRLAHTEIILVGERGLATLTEM